MIGSVKEKFGAQGRAVTVVYNGFSCDGGEKKDVLYATESRNCDCGDGRLKCGLGEELFTKCSGGWVYPAQTFTPLRIFLRPYKEQDENVARFRMGITTTKHCLYEYEKQTAAFKKSLEFSLEIKPVVASNENNEKILSVYCGIGVWGYTGKLIDGEVLAGCNFAGRNFYAARPYRIYFSAVCKPTVFADSANESGWFDLTENGGYVVALVEHADELYVFRDFSVLRLLARGKASEFQVETLPYHGGAIYGESVVSCGEKVFFVAKDGLWTFDGAAFKKLRVGERICPHATAPNFRAVYACGKYILQYVDEKGENKSLVIAGDGESAYFAFFRPALSGSYGYGLSYRYDTIRYATQNGKLPSGEKYYFKTQCSLGAAGRKTLKTLTFYGSGTVDISVSNGEREDKFSLDFSQGAQTVRLDMKGDKFSLTFELGEQSSVQQVKAMGYAL